MKRRRNKGGNFLIDPDEVLLDSTNLPNFDTQQFEGRMERALSKRTLVFVSLFFLLLGMVYTSRLFYLQVMRASEYSVRSEDNNLRVVLLPNERGVISDRNGALLAWNDPSIGRMYTKQGGLSHILGYLGYPSAEEVQLDIVPTPLVRVGRMGAEEEYDRLLRGSIGLVMQEVDAFGEIVSESLRQTPVDGAPLVLSIDSTIQSKMYDYISSVAKDRGFVGGAGVIIDVRSGEIIAMTSYPEFPLSVMSGTTTAEEISKLFSDNRTPFLNRAISGLYAPGSIVKPIMAIGALSEKLISPEKQILSTGKLELPNRYAPGQYTIFKDWKAHGLVDMRRAIAVSSNVYFYVIGGGFENQKGLGIKNIDKYSAIFGLGSKTGVDLAGEQEGQVPSPEWKKATFNGEDWLLGDTYHTSIGQYGFQVTPIQMANAIAIIASDGKKFVPHIIASSTPIYSKVDISSKNLQVARDGMRLGATIGTGSALNVPYAKFAVKTGTAELGVTKARVNSWVEGFFPYDDPRYAFAIVMERGHVGNVIGAVYVARQLFDWMSVYKPEYFSYNTP